MVPVPKLTWSHYIILITVKDEEKRKEFEQLVISEGLSRRELRELARKYKKEINKGKTPKLTEKRGFPYSYKLKPITEEENTLLDIDLGFRVYMNKLKKCIIHIENCKQKKGLAPPKLIYKPFPFQTNRIKVNKVTNFKL